MPVTGKAFFCYFFESRQKSTLPRVIKRMFGIQMRRVGCAAGVSSESIRHDDEKEVGKRDHQAEGEADGGFLAVSRDPEWHRNQGERHAGE